MTQYTNWRLSIGGMVGGGVGQAAVDEFEVLLAKGEGSLTLLWMVIGNEPLSRAAVRHLSAPASSSAVERLFSNVKNVFSEKRRRMKPGEARHSVSFCNFLLKFF